MALVMLSERTVSSHRCGSKDRRYTSRRPANRFDNPGRVQEGVEGVVLGEDTLGRLTNPVVRRQLDGEERSPVGGLAERPDRFLAFPWVPTEDDDTMALSQELSCRLDPDAAVTATDEDVLHGSVASGLTGR